MRSLVPLLLAAVMSTPLASQGAPSPKATLLAADLAWADSVAARSASFADVLTDDALYLYPGAPLMRGREVVARFVAAQPAVLLRWQPLRAEVSLDGTAGATFGVTAASAAGRAPEMGRYITYWRRQGDAWRAVAVMHTSGAEPVLSPEVAASFRPDTVGTGARGEAERADRAFAADAGVHGAGEAFRAAAAPEAIMFGGPGVLRLGPDEIRAGFGSGGTWLWRPVASGAAASGDLAFTVGQAEITSPTPDGPRTFHSKYLTIWRRQADGSWKYITDGGNGRPAP